MGGVGWGGGIERVRESLFVSVCFFSPHLSRRRFGLARRLELRLDFGAQADLLLELGGA